MENDILKILKSLENRVSTLERMPITSLNLGSTGVLIIPVVTSDPVSPSNGQIWYNSTSNLFKCRQGGITKTFTTT